MREGRGFGGRRPTLEHVTELFPLQQWGQRVVELHGSGDDFGALLHVAAVHFEEGVRPQHLGRACTLLKAAGTCDTQKGADETEKRTATNLSGILPKLRLCLPSEPSWRSLCCPRAHRGRFSSVLDPNPHSMSKGGPEGGGVGGGVKKFSGFGGIVEFPVA